MSAKNIERLERKTTETQKETLETKTRKENWIRLARGTGLVYVFLFVGGACLFLFSGGYLLQNINELSAKVFTDLPAESVPGRFWLVLTLSMMTNISLLSWFIWKNPVRYYSYFAPLCMSKFTSAAFGLIFFLWYFIFPDALQLQGAGSLATLVIFMTDFPLGLWALHLRKQGADLISDDLK